MVRLLAVATLALSLAGCGYFDEQPANVRPENEAVDAVMRTATSSPITDTSPQPAGQTAAASQAPEPARRAMPSPALPPQSPAAIARSRVVVAPQAPARLPSAPTEPAVPPARNADEAPPPPLPPPPAVFPSAQTEFAVQSGSSAGAGPASQPPAAPSFGDECQAVAKQRADDGGAAGMDDETQRIVRKGTYADCMVWHAAHAGS